MVFWFETGGILESGDDELENAFRHAVDRVNNDRTVLPRAKLVARIEKIKPHDSFHAAKLSKSLIISTLLTHRLINLSQYPLTYYVFMLISTFYRTLTRNISLTFELYLNVSKANVYVRNSMQSLCMKIQCMKILCTKILFIQSLCIQSLYILLVFNNAKFLYNFLY